MKSLDELRAMLEKATPGPWRAMREGNQYVDVTLDGRRGTNTASHGKGTLVGASRVEGLQRPWNPWWVGDSTSPETQETVRLADADADFIVAARDALPALLEIVAAAQKLNEAMIEWGFVPEVKDEYLALLAALSKLTSEDAIAADTRAGRAGNIPPSEGGR